MELESLDVDGGQLLVTDLDACWVLVRVQLGADRQAGLGGGTGDEVDDDVMADQRSPCANEG